MGNVIAHCTLQTPAVYYGASEIWTGVSNGAFSKSSEREGRTCLFSSLLSWLNSRSHSDLKFKCQKQWEIEPLDRGLGGGDHGATFPATEDKTENYFTHKADIKYLYCSTHCYTGYLFYETKVSPRASPSLCCSICSDTWLAEKEEGNSGLSIHDGDSWCCHGSHCSAVQG